MKTAYDQLHDMLLGQSDGDRFIELLDQAIEDADEEGYNNGTRDADQLMKQFEHKEEELTTRFFYLSHGGDFQRVDEMEAPSEYARGFLDAMKTIGVKP